MTAQQRRRPTVDALAGQTVVVIGGTSGIGLETARQARPPARADPDRPRPRPARRAGGEVGAVSTATLDLGDPAGWTGSSPVFPTVDHVLVTGGGPTYVADRRPGLRPGAPRSRRAPAGLAADRERVRGRVRPGGSLTLITGTHARRPGVGLSIAAIAAAAVPGDRRELAVELAPIRANVIAAGFVDTPLSARLLGDRAGASAGRAPSHPADPPGGRTGDVAALAIHLMTNTAVTGSTYDVDGGQQLIP